MTATFSLIQSTQTLTVTRQGRGEGSVTSSPAGINCGGTCSAAYGTGTSVTLTATAAAGSQFAGWRGACLGEGACQVTVNAATHVSATFHPVTTPGRPETGVIIGSDAVPATLQPKGNR